VIPRRKTLARTPFKPRRRPTGFSRTVVAQAIDRDQRCVLCGLISDPRSLTGHHRRNRGSGGSSDPATHSIRNCLAVCWPCNGLMESSPFVAAEARDRGVKLASWQDVTEPVQYPDGRWWVLDIHGQRHRQEEAA
jgi:hypothetical protein